MKKMIEVEELKKIQIDLLNVLDDYCNRNGLTYYLTYGTLIGAVRHKGYIPWDDDIDVMMPRTDYENFIAGFNSSGHASNIKVFSHETDPDYYLAFAKLINTATVMQEEVNSNYQIGVYIDIFPLDNLSDDYEIAKKRMRKAFRYNELMLFKNLTLSKERAWYKNAVLKVGRIVSSFWSRNGLIKKLNNFNIYKKNGGFTKYVGSVVGITVGDESRVFESKWFQSTVTVEFEDHEFIAPAGYDAFLRKLYGDYMKLPPPEEQISHHEFKAWYNE